MCLGERTRKAKTSKFIIHPDVFLFSICFPGCVVLTCNAPCLKKHKVQADPFSSLHLNGFSSSFCQSSEEKKEKENISFLNWMKNV